MPHLSQCLIYLGEIAEGAAWLDEVMVAVTWPVPHEGSEVVLSHA